MALLVLSSALWLIASASAESTRAQCNYTNPCSLTGGLPLTRCPELKSKDGFLDVSLSVEIGYFKFDWLELPRRSYNGVKCPPTWRVKPGDVVNVTLINRLNEGTHVPGVNEELNITNLHTHGLHISPLEPQDNVFVMVRPGDSYQYSFKIKDDHPAGTYWYHAHHHKSTTLQTFGGMAGMLIVEDDPAQGPAELRAVSCPENCDHDISLLISPMLRMSWLFFSQNTFGDSLRLPPDLEIWMEKNVNHFTVNGDINPAISLRRNQMTRFRILNVGFVSPLELRVIDENENDAPCLIREIARDGVYLDRPTPPRLGQSVLYPGNRVDWLIKCTAVGNFQLYSHAKEQHDISFTGAIRETGVIASIEVQEGTLISPALDLPQVLPSRPHHLADLRNAVPDQYIVVELGGDFTFNREKFSAPTNYRYKLEVGSVVEIQLINTGFDFSHPIHFHVNHVQVIGFQPYTGPVNYFQLFDTNWELRDLNGELCDYQHKDYVEGAATKSYNASAPLLFEGLYDRWIANRNDSLGYLQSGQWLETVPSPALSNMTLRMRVNEFTGPMVIHCHIPYDSDSGMIMVVEIVQKGGDLSGANILSNGIAPGSCGRCDWNRFIDMPSDCPRKDATRVQSDVVLNLLLTLLLTLRGDIGMIDQENEPHDIAI